MRRSIRWTLLGWYAAILVLVMSGFGIGLYLHQRRAALAEVDAELRTHALAISNAVEWDPLDGFELELGENYKRYLQQEGPDARYLAIWKPDGEVMMSSPALPADVTSRPGAPSEDEARREILARGANGTTILVGRHVSTILRESRNLGWSILMGALAALVLALSGGWLLVRHVLKPIDRMSESASRISASNLTERIDVGRTESELGRLAGTLNEAFDRLEDAVSRQARFTADASHELRTPLAVVRASADWALRRKRDSEDYVEALEGTRRAADRMRVLVDDLLALARSDAGAVRLRSEEVDLASVAEGALALVAPLAREKGLSLSCRAEPAPLRGDADRLLAVTAGLLANAVQHGAKGGHVQLSSGADDSQVWLEVRDDGAGIPEQHLPRIFERFYRADASRTEQTGGSGLGLAIAKEVVELHGGEITAASAPGEGTTVRIRIPRS